ncbi:hypothetical protein ACIBG4_40950 [Nonomuraea sp. NPDC050383]|uniref:hypothetical protein n=1 Tax=Nonomuraea sp. NPDC050383 TaxID=3364362 RepID=UPI00379FB1D0
MSVKCPIEAITETACVGPQQPQGVVEIANNGVGERPSKHAAASGEGRDAVQHLTDEQLLDPRFMRGVITKMATELDTAHKLIGRLFDALDAAQANHAPPEVRHALARRGRRVHFVTEFVNGHEVTVGVLPTGRDDPADADRRWQRLREQYSGGQDQ